MMFVRIVNKRLGFIFFLLLLFFFLFFLILFFVFILLFLNFGLRQRCGVILHVTVTHVTKCDI